jgi:hydrogenase maturation protease
MRIAVLGMGNSVMTDDAVGLKVVELLETRGLPARLPPGVEVGFLRNEAGGWEILDDVEGFDALVLVDACIAPSLQVGQCAWFEPGQFTSPRMSGTHNMDVFSALDLGRKSGLHVPSTVVALGIGAKEIYSFSEELTPDVAAAVPVAAQLVIDKVLDLASAT